MVETWLRPNRRVLWLGCTAPLLTTVVGALIVVWRYRQNTLDGWLFFGLGLLMLGAAAVAGLLLMLMQPPVACDPRHVRFHLGQWRSIHVPMEAIDCFFLGEGSSGLGSRASGKVKASHLVVRFAERAVEWHNRDMKPAFGKWQDGYLSIYGTWCESLDEDLVRELNKRLAAAKRIARESQ